MTHINPTPEPASCDCTANPVLTAQIGFPVRCPHCSSSAGPVPSTHWTKHVQRHHPEAAVVSSPSRDDLRDLIADVLRTTPRADYEAATAHRNHRYDARCALCAYETDTNPADRGAFSSVSSRTLSSIACHLAARAVAIMRPESDTYAEWQTVAAELRRLADEAQPTETAPAEEAECCGAEPPDAWPGDCWCTLPVDHGGEHRCQPCTDRHGAHGWPDEQQPAADGSEETRHG